ncbi:hypothetical protein EC973_004033 [Apophysomyces ossiformis]|uniref:UBA domain-containing protein n=1 Tax=Apophysomyces ossiformis TaxID=679940 RepID=A0A8H7ESP1_9FUNG|nr:hypothetical protein EC973_004033 [Apophysomyces ossiformis]
MDDLLDLDWSGKSSPNSSIAHQGKGSSKATPAQEKKKDAFADLLGFPSSRQKESPPLSLAEQQRLAGQNATFTAISSTSPSPTIARTTATTPIPQKPSFPISQMPSPKSIYSAPLAPAKSKAANNFDSILSPFDKKTTTAQDTSNLPLNALRSQTSSTSSPVQNPPAEQWDFDLLESVNSAGSPAPSSIPAVSNVNSDAVDPFDVDFLTSTSNQSVQQLQTQQDMTTQEQEDNPLGILAEPVVKPHPSSSEEHVSELPGRSEIQPNPSSLEPKDDTLLAQLIDMGFELEAAKVALEATGGTDLQAAVDLLVQNSEAMRGQRQKDEGEVRGAVSANQIRNNVHQMRTTRGSDVGTPSSVGSGTEKSEDSFLQHKERIVAQATELGGLLYKNASMFVKTGRQRITKAVEDWQEQQRNMGQSQSRAPSRPKWMSESADDEPVESLDNVMEKFADDPDDEADVQLEQEQLRRKQMEEKRRMQEQQEIRRRQQEKQAMARKEQQKQQEEEVYVSPSRRRGIPSSGRSTPQVITEQKPTRPQPKRNERTRPLVQASPEALSIANAERQRGNEQYKLGQFGDAEASYSRAIEALPSGHDHLVLLSNNRALARLKIGEHKKCISDCDIAIEMARSGGDGSSESAGITIQWQEQIVKALHRKGEALEHLEKYKEALRVYEELRGLEGNQNAKLNHALTRCRKAIAPDVPKKKPAVPAKATSPPKKDNIHAIFEPALASQEINNSKAVAEMRAMASQQEAEEVERLEKVDAVNAKLLQWKAGKEQNLRALLATLDMLLWPGAQWSGTQMSELINPKRCKIIYLKAIGKVHPDKLPSSVTVEQRMLASGIFSTLNEAWDSFKAQNNL